MNRDMLDGAVVALCMVAIVALLLRSNWLGAVWAFNTLVWVSIARTRGAR